MDDLLIRHARPEDIDTIVDYQLRLAMETEDLALDPETVRRGVRGVFEVPGRGRYFMAESGGTPVATLLVTNDWSDWRAARMQWIHSVYVIPRARRCGVYRRMEKVVREEALASPDVAGIRMLVDKTNEASQRAHEAMGYTRDHYDTYEWLKAP